MPATSVINAVTVTSVTSTGELYKQQAQEMISCFSKLAINSEIPFHAAAGIEYCGTLGIFESGACTEYTQCDFQIPIQVRIGY